MTKEQKDKAVDIGTGLIDTLFDNTFAENLLLSEEFESEEDQRALEKEPDLFSYFEQAMVKWLERSGYTVTKGNPL